MRNARVRFAHAVAIAIVLRAMMLIPQPFLSGDVYRYLFDGRTLAAGHNPYAAFPDDPRVNHPEIRTIYPPHAEILFALFHQLTLWRIALLLAELATLRLLRDRGALAYATFPPLIFEGIWSAHVEVVAALLLAVAFFRNSAVAAACSGIGRIATMSSSRSRSRGTSACTRVSAPSHQAPAAMTSGA